MVFIEKNISIALENFYGTKNSFIEFYHILQEDFYRKSNYTSAGSEFKIGGATWLI